MKTDPPTTAGDALGPRWIRMERRLDASYERAYRAWADPEELGRWLAPEVDGGLAPGTRTWLLWPQARAWWDVVEAQASTRLVFRRAWTPDDRLVTTTTVSIVPVGYGTRVEIADGPFPLDVPGGLDAWARALTTWAETLVMLRAYLDFSVDVREPR
jgi:uncharacterized protein YndB with AHSA1/START domain